MHLPAKLIDLNFARSWKQRVSRLVKFQYGADEDLGDVEAVLGPRLANSGGHLYHWAATGGYEVCEFELLRTDGSSYRSKARMGTRIEPPGISTRYIATAWVSVARRSK